MRLTLRERIRPWGRAKLLREAVRKCFYEGFMLERPENFVHLKFNDYFPFFLLYEINKFSIEDCSSLQMQRVEI